MPSILIREGTSKIQKQQDDNEVEHAVTSWFIWYWL